MKFKVKVPTKKCFFQSGRNTTENYDWFTNQSMIKTFRGIPIYGKVKLHVNDDGTENFWIGISVIRLIESKIFLTWGMTVKGDQRIVFEFDYKREFTEESGDSWGSIIDFFDDKQVDIVLKIQHVKISEFQKLDILTFDMSFPTVLHFEHFGRTAGYDGYRNISPKKLIHGIDIFVHCEIRKHRDGRQTPAFYLKIGDQSFQSLEAAWSVSFTNEKGNVTYGKNFEKFFVHEKSWGVNLLPNLPSRKTKIKIAFSKFNVTH